MKRPAPLAFKPDLEMAAKRWEAFYAGDIIDRPLVCVTAPKKGAKGLTGSWSDYYERVNGDMDEIIDRTLRCGEATFYGGESIPSFGITFGPDETAIFCGGELRWSKDSYGTNWSTPFVENWQKVLPLKVREDNPLWRRMLEFYKRAVNKMAGKMLVSLPDFHTNMDLLAAIRGPEKLCMDLADMPEMIDEAMKSARQVFPVVWDAVKKAGRMDELGYFQCMYSMEGAAMLQCDFSAMISPAMFRKWVLPALEEEAGIVKHVFYHWDGPSALVHEKDIIASKGLFLLSYVPGEGHGNHIRHLDLLKRLQAQGKAVHAGGSIDDIKAMHKDLRPEKVMYETWAPTQDDAQELLDWLVKNT